MNNSNYNRLWTRIAIVAVPAALSAIYFFLGWGFMSTRSKSIDEQKKNQDSASTVNEEKLVGSQYETQMTQNSKDSSSQVSSEQKPVQNSATYTSDVRDSVGTSAEALAEKTFSVAMPKAAFVSESTTSTSSTTKIAPPVTNDTTVKLPASVSVQPTKSSSPPSSLPSKIASIPTVSTASISPTPPPTSLPVTPPVPVPVTVPSTFTPASTSSNSDTNNTTDTSNSHTSLSPSFSTILSSDSTASSATPSSAGMNTIPSTIIPSSENKSPLQSRSNITTTTSNPLKSNASSEASPSTTMQHSDETVSSSSITIKAVSTTTSTPKSTVTSPTSLSPSAHKPEELSCKHTLTGHANMVYCVVVAPNGDIFSGSRDLSIRQWRPNPESTTIEFVKKFSGHKDWVKALVVLSEQYLLSGSPDNFLIIWDINTGEAVQTIPVLVEEGQGSAIRCAALWSGISVMTGGDDLLVRMWDTTQGEVVLSMIGAESPIQCLIKVNNDNLATGESKGKMRVYSISQCCVLQVIAAHRDSVCSLAITCEQHIISVSWDKTMKVWERSDSSASPDEAYACARTVVCPSKLQSALVSPDGCYVTGDFLQTKVRVWNPKGDCKRPVKIFGEHTGTVWCLALTPEGDIVSGSSDKTLRIFSHNSS